MDATRREAQLREQLQDVSERLSSMEATFGDQSAVPLPPDVAQLTEHLKQRDEEIKRLKLQEMHRQQSEAALYAELDRLSSAWESLERQVKGKIFDLSAMEERLSKSALDVGLCLCCHFFSRCAYFIAESKIGEQILRCDERQGVG